MLTAVLTGLWLGVIFNVAPGPVFTESLRRGVRGGFRPALGVQVGSLVGDAVWAVLGLAGAAAIMTQPTLRVPLTLAGCLVLAYLGIKGLRDALSRSVPVSAHPQSGPGAAEAPLTESSMRRALVAGALMSLGTVWNVVYWGGAGGAVAGALGDDAALESLVAFFAAFMVVSLAWCFICAGLIAGMRRALSARWTRVVEGVAGAALIVMAAALLFQTL